MQIIARCFLRYQGLFVIALVRHVANAKHNEQTLNVCSAQKRVGIFNIEHVFLFLYHQK